MKNIAPDKDGSMTADTRQRIAVFQQNGSGEAKIAGIRRYGEHLIQMDNYAIDQPLPSVLDDTTALLPERLQADLVLDYLRHPDLSEDLCAACERQHIPIVAPGGRGPYALTPPT
jgi:hypothetical protein